MAIPSVAWPSERHAIERQLSAAVQRARLLVNGVAGPLSDRQRALALDLLRDLEKACEGIGSDVTRDVRTETFDLGPMVADTIGMFRFVAHRKQLALTLMGAAGRTACVADLFVTREALYAALNAALGAAPAGSRVSVEIARSADRIAVDISAAGWSPSLPPAPPAGSRVAISVLRTAAGSRLVISIQAA